MTTTGPREGKQSAPEWWSDDGGEGTRQSQFSSSASSFPSASFLSASSSSSSSSSLFPSSSSSSSSCSLFASKKDYYHLLQELILLARPAQVSSRGLFFKSLTHHSLFRILEMTLLSSSPCAHQGEELWLWYDEDDDEDERGGESGGPYRSVFFGSLLFSSSHSSPGWSWLIFSLFLFISMPHSFVITCSRRQLWKMIYWQR